MTSSGREAEDLVSALGCLLPPDRGSVSLLLGTVSQYVLRRAPCPVLVVPPATPVS